MLNEKRDRSYVLFDIGGATIKPSKHIKYLGCHIRENMKFGHHVTCVASKAVEKIAAMARIMLNIGGPDSQKRLLLYGVAQPTMSYAAELWADIVSVAKYRTILEGAQRKALLRVAAAYRTVSSEALQVITTGTPPIDITLQLRRELHIEKKKGRCISKNAQLDILNQKWTTRWSGTTKAT